MGELESHYHYLTKAFVNWLKVHPYLIAKYKQKCILASNGDRSAELELIADLVNRGFCYYTKIPSSAGDSIIDLYNAMEAL